jgi:opacity protein-like surface antigen
MKSSRILLVTTATLGLIALSAVAQRPGEGPTYEPVSAGEYGWVEVGYAYTPDFDATLSTVTTNGWLSRDAKMELGPGFALQGGLGQSFSRWISAELVGGFYYNDVDQMSIGGGMTRGLDASLMQAPAMVNLVVHVPVRWRLQPVLGAGAGAMFSWLNVDDQISMGDGRIVRVDGSSTEVTFAYQLFAGLRYRHGDGASIALTYRFTGVGSPTWGLEDAVTGESVADVKAHDLCVHSLNLGFYMGF